MKFYKAIEDGFIVSIGSTTSDKLDGNLTESEYNTIMQKIQSKPTDPVGYQHKLRADNLEWELIELPEPEPVDYNADISDYENALSDLGVRFGD